jgi:hypothetical protein
LAASHQADLLRLRLARLRVGCGCPVGALVRCGRWIGLRICSANFLLLLRQRVASNAIFFLVTSSAKLHLASSHHQRSFISALSFAVLTARA